jgi:hypothetical protein
MDKNCLSYWFPILQSVVPANVPRTIIIPAPPDGLTSLLVGQQPDEWPMFLLALRGAGKAVGYPCFLRSGHTSDKHSWDKTCYIAKPEDFGSHVCSIVDFSECCSLIGLPYNVWAVREWLNGPIIGTAPRYCNMPVRREFRIFIRDGKIQCGHPYWPVDALLSGGCNEDTMAQVEAMNHLGIDRQGLHYLVSKVATVFDGYWSVDCLWTNQGWFVTDMALGDDSWHWPGCGRLPEAQYAGI